MMEQQTSLIDPTSCEKLLVLLFLPVHEQRVSSFQLLVAVVQLEVPAVYIVRQTKPRARDIVGP